LSQCETGWFNMMPKFTENQYAKPLKRFNLGSSWSVS
jgi:hypothetical protein